MTILTKPKEPEINPEKPWEHNILDREKIGVMLTTFIESLNEPFVLSITSEFGTGKSFFIKQWVAHLRKEEIACIEFNAWASDFSKEPLISFIGEITEYVRSNEKLYGKESSVGEEFLTNLAEKGTNLLKTFVPVLTKVALKKFISDEDLNSLIVSEIDSKIKKHSEEKKTVKEFREILKELALKVQTVNENRKPIVFVIDELDRCRPTYAIELLEVIKHFFNVPGFVFVLAIDKNQILNSIRTQYGQGMDADGYLRRFVDLEYNLPMLNRIEFIGLSTKNYSTLSDNIFQKDLLEIFCNYFDLSLRKMQQLIQKLEIINLISFKNGTKADTSDYNIIIFMLCLQSYSFDLYHRFIERTMNAENLFDEFLRIKKPQDQSYLKNEMKLVIGTIFIRDNFFNDIVTFKDNLDFKRNKLTAPPNGKPSFIEIQEEKKLQIIIDSLNYLSSTPKLNSQSFMEKAKMISHFADIIGSITQFKNI